MRTIDNQQYAQLLKRVEAYLERVGNERGLHGRGFGYGDPVGDPSIAYEDKEIFFVLGNVMVTDGSRRVVTEPHKTGDRITWAIKKVADNNGFALAVHYYIFGDDNHPLCTIGYIEENVEKAAEDIYQFLVNGSVPDLVKQRAN